MNKILLLMFANLMAFNAFNQNSLSPNQKKAVEYHDMGFLSYLGKDYLNAIEYFTKSIKMDSMLVGNYIDRGSVFKDNGQYVEAEKDFKTVIRIGKEQAFQGYNNLGNLYKKQKKYLDAVNQFNRAIILNSKCFECYYNRAQTYEKLSKSKEAINDYTSAINLNSNYANAYYNRGNLKYAAKDISGAIDDYSRALALNPENKFEICYNRGMSYAANKQHKEAKSDFEEYISFDKTNADAYYNVSICCYYLNEMKEACKYANESLKLGNNNAKAIMTESCK